LVLGNHDSRRWIDRVNGDLQKAKLIALLQLTARGVPVVYYGEEIGLPEGRIPAKNALDPVGQRYAWAPKWLLDIFKLYVNRDNCRTPMAWDSSGQAGFTESDRSSWLPLSTKPDTVNVANQEKNPDSLLNWYKTLLKFRKTSPALLRGSLNLLPAELAKKGLLGYIRQDKLGSLGILINMSASPIEVELIGERLEVLTGEVSLSPDKVTVDGYSGCILRINGMSPNK
jgi:glycosidase